MKLDTRNFGEIEIDESGIITFESGLPGFENLKRFAVLMDSDMVVDWLQGIDEDVTFPIINPFSITDDYEFKIPDCDVKKLQIESQKDVLIYSVVTIPAEIEDIRANLRAPIVINKKGKLAKQLILDEKYPVKYKFFDRLEG